MNSITISGSRLPSCIAPTTIPIPPKMPINAAYFISRRYSLKVFVHINEVRVLLETDTKSLKVFAFEILKRLQASLAADIVLHYRPCRLELHVPQPKSRLLRRLYLYRCLKKRQCVWHLQNYWQWRPKIMLTARNLGTLRQKSLSQRDGILDYDDNFNYG